MIRDALILALVALILYGLSRATEDDKQQLDYELSQEAHYRYVPHTREQLLVEGEK